MADPNDAVFALAQQVVFNVVVDKAGNNAASRARQIRSFVKHYNNDVYKGMMQTGMFASDETPSILTQNNPFGKTWAAHKTDDRGNSAYLDKKAAQGFDTPGFYRRTGALSRAMGARSGNSDFGAAEVTVGISGKGINTAKYKLDSQGRPRYIKGSRDLAGRGIGGRFAGMSAFSSLVFTIEMQLFTRVEGNVTQGQLEELYGGEPFGVKMLVGEFGRTGGKGRAQPARPLIRPFLHWYATTNFRNQFYQRFQIKV